jgi:hypothetical protein
MHPNRRDDRRVPLHCFVTEYVGERAHRALVTNVSEHGIRVQRLLGPGGRHSRVVQIELELPGTQETIWAKGETRHDELEIAPFGPVGLGPTTTLHSSGIHVVALASRHARLMRDYVFELRRRHMRDVLLRSARRTSRWL